MNMILKVLGFSNSVLWTCSLLYFQQVNCGCSPVLQVTGLFSSMTSLTEYRFIHDQDIPQCQNRLLSLLSSHLRISRSVQATNVSLQLWCLKKKDCMEKRTEKGGCRRQRGEEGKKIGLIIKIVQLQSKVKKKK